MPSSLHIDFSSVIDNARLNAARHAGPAPAVHLKSSRWNALRKEVRAIIRRPAAKANPAAHAH